MRIAITGAFSYSGKYIANRLLEHGEEVITLTNHPDRPDPFKGKVKAFPLDFKNVEQLKESLKDVDALINTYWIRFDYKEKSQPGAVENTRKLINAAVSVKVKRIVHISITNPSLDSPLPYFWGKAANEKVVIESGMSYAILRPTVLVGTEDILINNIAFLLKRFPIFTLPGDGLYRLQPVCVEDFADLAVDAIYRNDNYIIDTVGPDIFTFKEMVELIETKVGVKRPLVPVPPRLAWRMSQLIGLFLGDILLTREEVVGLMADLLVSKDPPLCRTHLADWLEANKDKLGKRYASELKRHYQ